jgi:hypothetical protein
MSRARLAHSSCFKATMLATFCVYWYCYLTTKDKSIKEDTVIALNQQCVVLMGRASITAYPSLPNLIPRLRMLYQLLGPALTRRAVGLRQARPTVTSSVLRCIIATAGF